MNDSFLEDLDLIPKEEKKKTQQQPDCHITTRNATLSPLFRFLEQDEKDNAVQLQMKYSVITDANISDVKIIGSKDVVSKELNNEQSNQNVKRHSMNVKISEKIKKVNDGKEKSVDVKRRLDNNKQQSSNREHKIKVQETRTQNLKVPENKIVNKGHKRYSESRKESTRILSTSVREKRLSSDSSNSHSPDVSSKENSRPSDSSKETGSCDLSKRKPFDELKRSGFKVSDQDMTVIKELISTYTREESTKILRAMQEVYMNSTATLMKQFLIQTDDLIKEMHLCTGKESDRVRTLIEENERLQSEVFGLRREVISLGMRNEDLQNKLEEIEFLKQENAALKLQLH